MARDEQYYADRQAERTARANQQAADREARAAKQAADRAERLERDQQRRADRAQQDANRAAERAADQARDDALRAERNAQREETAAARNARQDALRAQREQSREEARERADDRRDEARYGGGLLGDVNRFVSEDVFKPLESFNRSGARLSQSRAQWNRTNDQMHRSGARSLESDARYDVRADNQDFLYAREEARLASTARPFLNQLQGQTQNPSSTQISASSRSPATQSTEYTPPSAPPSAGPNTQPQHFITNPLKAAMLAKTATERDAYLDQAISQAHAYGLDKPIAHPQEWNSLSYKTAQGQEFVQVPLAPNEWTPAMILSKTADAVPSQPFKDAFLARANAYNQQHGKVVAPAPSQTSPAAPAAGTTAPSSATIPGGASAATPVPGGTAQVSEGEALSLPASSKPAAKPYALKKQDAPPSLAYLSQDLVEPLQKLMSEKPALRAILATTRKPDGVDGVYGPKTFQAIGEVARAAGITDLNTIKFNDPNDATTKRFMTALTSYGQEKAPAPAKPDPLIAAAQQQTAEAQARAQAAEAAAARAQADTNERPELRNTPFDSRNLAQMGPQARKELVQDTLLNMRELKRDRNHKDENLADKLEEAVERANRLLGLKGEGAFQAPSDRNPYTNDAMTALGIVAAREGAIPGVDPMQSAMARAQAQGLSSSIRGGENGGVPGNLSASTARGSANPGQDNVRGQG